MTTADGVSSRLKLLSDSGRAMRPCYLRPRSMRPRSRSSVGERPPHTRKVAGSIPAGTTPKKPSSEVFSKARNHLGLRATRTGGRRARVQLRREVVEFLFVEIGAIVGGHDRRMTMSVCFANRSTRPAEASDAQAWRKAGRARWDGRVIATWATGSGFGSGSSTPRRSH
ncbi:MAG: hypothetical protein QOE09_3079 [Ilumatobacteraceae bacterium]